MSKVHSRHNYTSTVKTVMSCLGDITVARAFWGQIAGEINLIDPPSTNPNSPSNPTRDTIDDAKYTAMWEDLGPIEQAMVAKELVDHFGPNLKAILALILSPQWSFQTSNLPPVQNADVNTVTQSDEGKMNADALDDVEKGTSTTGHNTTASPLANPDLGPGDEFVQSKEFEELERARIERDLKRKQYKKATQSALKNQNSKNGHDDQSNSPNGSNQCQSGNPTSNQSQSCVIDNDQDDYNYCGPCCGEDDDEEEDDFWSPDNLHDENGGGEYWDNDIVGVHQAGLFWDESSDEEGKDKVSIGNPSSGIVNNENQPQSQSPTKPSQSTVDHLPPQPIDNNNIDDEEDDEDAIALKRYLAKRDAGLGIDDDDDDDLF